MRISSAGSRSRGNRRAVAPTDPDQLPSERLPLGGRAWRGLTRFLIAFGIGVVATLAWQSYGDAARGMIASFGWLAPAAAPDASSPDLQELIAIELKAMSTDLAAVRQSVDQLAAQFVARFFGMPGALTPGDSRFVTQRRDHRSYAQDSFFSTRLVAFLLARRISPPKNSHTVPPNGAQSRP
jgi:hypothetical protein